MKSARWKRRKEERTPEILEAALACFGEKGFAATRMDDVAARAGITKGTIYLYFDSKQAVFKALARQSAGAQIAAIAEQVKTSDTPSPELLRFVILSMGQFLRTTDRIILPRVLLSEMGNFPELAEFWRREIIDKGLGLFETIIKRGIARGEFRKLPTQHAARLCIAPLLVMALWRMHFEKFDSVPYDYEGLVETHIQTLLRGLQDEGNPS
ncbi:MAG TPA: TetR/AcrR family transcriptional regulator [Rhizomicrobium sp.]|jgi:AcrR family transcriptional regulator|nr:TetR/AcrR family transcriptional regulator [Rhizomicrobium sp.]